ncbi:MAG: hypothetical protein AAF152_15445 [Cyanobacteria bacterium P01_A01_bin.114]
MYYLIDWILKQGNQAFSLSQVVKASKQMSVKIAFAEEVAPEMIGSIITLLTEHDYLETVANDINQVQVVDSSVKPEKQYRITPRRLAETSGKPDGLNQEIEAFPSKTSDKHEIAHYRLVNKVGSGGMSIVYRAWDNQQDQFVAIKVLDPSLVVPARSTQTRPNFWDWDPLLSWLAWPV